MQSYLDVAMSFAERRKISMKTKRSNYEKRLTNEEWSEIYNPQNINCIVSDLKMGRLSFQSREMIKLTKTGDKVLEIGCGSGATSTYLAMNDREATALDFSEAALACTEGVANNIGVKVKTIQADATQILPFESDYFDVAFQAGLLEHFDKETRIDLLRKWGCCAKKMVSIIPNAASLAYRVGKALQENNATWEYGLELPQYSLIEEFNKAGFKIDKEYTIGAEHALNFLPQKHYLRKALEKWIRENPCEDICGQGYLLVTVGIKK